MNCTTSGGWCQGATAHAAPPTNLVFKSQIVGAARLPPFDPTDKGTQS